MEVAQTELQSFALNSMQCLIKLHLKCLYLAETRQVAILNLRPSPQNLHVHGI